MLVSGLLRRMLVHYRAVPPQLPIANTGGLRRELQVNGKAVPVDAEPAMPLLWVLRDLLNMTGAQALGTPGKTHVLQMGP